MVIYNVDGSNPTMPTASIMSMPMPRDANHADQQAVANAILVAITTNSTAAGATAATAHAATDPDANAIAQEVARIVKEDLVSRALWSYRV